MSENLPVPANVDPTTGEVLPAVPAFDPDQFAKGLKSGLSVQQRLAAAYDDAVKALIGPNDVQIDRGRSFKKKSAWRKLARHFNISTRIVGEPRFQMTDDAAEVAIVRVRAVAPWGQSVEAIGACGSDEEKGRRVITLADMIATAQTRATNRAVSDLIAMGEVSAEEIGKRAAYDDNREEAPARTGDAVPTPRAPAKPASGERVPDRFPFGKAKGKKFEDATDQELISLHDWCTKTDAAKFANLISAVGAHLASRGIGQQGDAFEEEESNPAEQESEEFFEDDPFFHEQQK